jgi:hypothetical protein
MRNTPADIRITICPLGRGRYEVTHAGRQLRLQRLTRACWNS